MNHFIGLSLMAGILYSTMASALVLAPKDASKMLPESSRDKLVHQAYSLQEQPMRTVNWLYVGEAPRVNDPSRIRVILSKQGFTMRVNFWMTPEEVVDYPNYLYRKAERMKEIIQAANSRPGHSLKIGQYHRVEDFFHLAGTIRDMGTSFDASYDLLKSFFPANIRRIPCPNDGRRICVEGNFVYPITIHKSAMVTLKDGTRYTRPMVQATPTAATYFTQYLDERRSAHYEYYKEGPLKGHRTGEIADHLFNGFPAFWFKTAKGSKGQGIHGPIRYSSTYDGGIVTNDYLNDRRGWENINPNYRFEVIRTANSEGCVRSEPMELRHILPSDPKLVKQVPIHIIDEIDMIDEDLDGRGDYYVDVDYYVENHYNKNHNKRAWYKKHFITYEERQYSQQTGTTIDQILDQKLQRTRVFPYLHPRAVEFSYMEPVKIEDDFGLGMDHITQQVSALYTMGQFNRAPAR